MEITESFNPRASTHVLNQFEASDLEILDKSTIVSYQLMISDLKPVEENNWALLNTALYHAKCPKYQHKFTKIVLGY